MPGNVSGDFVPGHGHSAKDLYSAIGIFFPSPFIAVPTTMNPTTTGGAFSVLPQMVLTTTPPQVPGISRWLAELFFSGEFNSDSDGFGAVIRFTRDGGTIAPTTRGSVSAGALGSFGICTGVDAIVEQNESPIFRVEWASLFGGIATAVGTFRYFRVKLSPIG